MSAIKYFLINNKIFIDWIASIGVLLASIFAYLSARASSMVGRIPYVPLITITSPKFYDREGQSFFQVVNNSESQNAIAKNVHLKLLGKDYPLGDIRPDFENRIDFKEEVNITAQHGEIHYKDIFNRKYTLQFYFGFVIFKKSVLEDRATNIDVGLNYKKLHI